MTIAGPGGTKIFFSDPPSGTVFALGSLVDVGPLQWPGGRLKREILRCYTFLPICLFPPKLRVVRVWGRFEISCHKNSQKPKIVKLYALVIYIHKNSSLPRSEDPDSQFLGRLNSMPRNLGVCWFTGKNLAGSIAVNAYPQASSVLSQCQREKSPRPNGLFSKSLQR